MVKMWPNVFLWCQQQQKKKIKERIDKDKQCKFSSRSKNKSWKKATELLYVSGKRQREQEIREMGNRCVGDSNGMNEHNCYIHSTLYMAQILCPSSMWLPTPTRFVVAAMQTHLRRQIPVDTAATQVPLPQNSWHVCFITENKISQHFRSTTLALQDMWD